MYSILASGDRSITNHYSYTYDKIGQAIDRSPIDLVDNKQQAKEHLFKRFILSLLTGNGDFHLENISIMKTDDYLGFTPVYDPTPMRAYPLHNMLSVMPFGNYGEILKNRDEPVNLKNAIQRLIKNLGIKKKNSREIINSCLNDTNSYIARMKSIKKIPGEHASKLEQSILKIRNKLSEMTV